MVKYPDLSRLSIILIAGLSAVSSHAAEFFDADILPQIAAISFEEHAISLQTGHGGYARFEFPAFVMDRTSGVFNSVHPDDIAGRPMKALGTHPSISPDASKVTSTGERYELLTTGPDYLPRITGLSINDRDFDLELEQDVGITEVELAHGKIWIGTDYTGDHGIWGAHGVIVMSHRTGKEVGRVDAGLYPISALRLDPYSGDIWAVTRDQVLILGADQQVKRKFSFYYDFDAQTERPVVRISEEGQKSHPLAVFALHLPESRYQEFYDAVSSIPDDIARSFSLYEMYMCCNFSSHTDESTKPDEFEILIPFLLAAFETDLPRWEYQGQSRSKYASRSWRQIACRHKSNKEARRLCDTEDWAVLLDQPEPVSASEDD